MIFINYCRNSMMKVNQLNQVVAAWLLIMATAVSMNAEIYPDELDGMHLRCPGGYYIIDSHHYTIKLFLRDGFNSIEGSTDINFELSKTNQIFREDRKKDSTKSRMCCETERNCQLNLRMDDKLVISDVSRDVRLERRGSIKSALGFGRENIMNIERTNDNNGDELIISIRFRSKLGSSYQGKLSIAYTRPSGAFKKVKGVKDHLITVDPLIMSKRLLRGQIFQLYPYFTLTGRRPIDPELEVIIEQPDVDNIVVTNAPWDGHSVELVQIEHPKHAQSDSLHELSFAVGPFNRETLLHSNNNILKDDYPVIRKIQSSDALEGFAGKFLKQTLDWLHNHSPPNWDKQIDSRYVFGYKFLAISPEATDIVYSQEPTVETALTVALRTARKWLSVKRPKSSCYSYVIEGLAVYFAIRMVRELEPSLKVDKYVRETLLPRALDYEIEGHYEELSLDYFYEFSDNRRVESIWWWRIKSAAIIEMMKRFLSQDQQAFDRSVLALLNYPKSNWIGPEEVRETFTGDSVSKFELHSFLSTWRQHSGYPYIGVSLDKQDSRSIRFDQVPIDWLHNKNNQIQSDHVWPMSLTMKFSDGIKTETIEMTSREGFNGKRVAVRLKLPNWFEHDNPEHKLWLDQGELFYYRVSYSSDLNAMSERNL